MKTSVLILLTLAAVATARAQAPVNDEFTTAVVIPSLPYAASENTPFATVAPDDPLCGGRGTTVWFSFTPTTNLTIEANTFGSDYDTTLSAYTAGTLGLLSQVFCNDDASNTPQSQVRFSAGAGITYQFLAGSFAGGHGGNLVSQVNPGRPAPPPLAWGLTV